MEEDTGMAADPKPTAGIEDLLAHSDWLWRLAGQLAVDRDPEDGLQDTWVAALRSPPKADRSTRPWLARVFHNALRGQRRAERVRERVAPLLADLQADAGVPSPHELLERAQLQRALAEAVVLLDE